MIPKIITSCVKNSIKGIKMQVNYTNFDNAVGYNCKNKKKPFYLLVPIYVIICYGGKKLYFKLEEGFTSDGCTIPYIFRWIIGCQHTPEYIPASLIHDWILQHPQTVHRNRKLSSLILKTALLNEGVKPLKAQLMYLAAELCQWWKNFKIRKWK